jgi:hypothetical protein
VKKTDELDEPVVLHIDLGNQPLSSWLKNNKYIIHSELVRYIEILISRKLDFAQAILITNFVENIVLIVRRENADITLDKAMGYFLSIEEYELCAKIRDLQILIEKSKTDEERDTKDSGTNKRKSKVH